jgi:hypothetical protein
MARQVFVAGVLAAVIGVSACSGSSKSVSTGATKPAATSTTSVVPTTSSSSSTAVTLTPTSGTTVAPPVVTTRPTTPVPTTVASTTTTTRPATSGPETFQVTSADHYLAVRVGDTVFITLSSSGMEWSQVVVSPTDLVGFLPVHSPPPNGQYVGLTAEAAGTVTITSSARPICGIGVACPMFILEWSFTLVIS